MSHYLQAIGWLCLIPVLSLLWGLLRVSGECARDEERQLTLRQRRALRAANKSFESKGESK